MWKRLADLTVKQGRRVVIAVIGGTVVLIGLALLVLPGPGMVVIPLGLAILATEFIWARRLLRQLKQRAGDAVNGAKKWFSRKKANGDESSSESRDDGFEDACVVETHGPISSPFEHPSGPASTDTRHAA